MSTISSRQLSKNTLWNLIGQGAPLVAALFSIPVLIRWMQTERFGLLTLVWVLVGYFSIFDFGLGRAVTQRLSNNLGRGSPESNSQIVSTAMLAMLFIGGLGGLLLFIATPAILGLLQVDAVFRVEVEKTLQLLSVSLPIVTLASCLNGALEAYQKFSVTNILKFFLGLWTYLAPLILSQGPPDLTSIVAVLMVGRIFVVVAAFAFLLKELKDFFRNFNFNFNEIKSLLSFGGWMTVSNVVSPLMVYSDRFFLSTFVPLSMVAYYTTPFEAMSKLLIVGTAFGGAIFPTIAKDLERDPRQVQKLVKRSTNTLLLVISFILILIVCAAPFGLKIWLGESFEINSTTVVRILGLGLLFNVMAQIPFAVIQGANRPDWTAKLHLAELPIYGLTLWYFLKNYGLVGAAAAWTLRVTADSVALHILSKKILSTKLREPS